MTRIRRGGYVFLTWIGDHRPRHVHVYRDGRFVLKWDLEHNQPMRGVAKPGLRELIRQMVMEGQL